jgi:ABC-type dipeptide/oligopeptide/nickel transport system ATPase component
MSALLTVSNLNIAFRSGDDWAPAVNGIDFSITAGKTVAIVGESGSGKSVTCLSLARLLPPDGVCRVSGKITFAGQSVLELDNKELRKLRGAGIAYVFQEPSASLNPVFTVGYQIAEAVKLHAKPGTVVQDRVVELLELVGIRDAAKRVHAYPHELSGGMQQRVMIAMALACEPKLLVADEPTTALDVTIQAQIIDLLRKLREQLGMTILLITHNFGIVKGFADEVIVMLRGEIVEQGPTAEVIDNPQHPYTQALIGCIPRLGVKQRRLVTIDRDQLITAST